MRQDEGRTRQIPFLYDRLTARSGDSNGNGPDAARRGQDNFCVRGGDIIVVP